ncbi:hypothetical protein CDAR_3871, partial [Caerostris darwini]
MLGYSVNPYEWVTNSTNLSQSYPELCFPVQHHPRFGDETTCYPYERAQSVQESCSSHSGTCASVWPPFFLVLYQPQSGQCVTLESYTFLSYAMDGLQ